MQVFSYEVIVNAITVFFAVIGGLTAVLALREKIIAARKPGKDLLDRHEQYLTSDHEDIEAIKKAIDDLNAENRIQTETHIAILTHMIDGNHVESLRERRDFIQRYLNDKAHA